MTSNTINDSLDLNLISGEDTGEQNGDLSPKAPRPTRVARPDADKLPIEIARLLSDTRCTDVIILDVRGLIDVQDFIVIASGTSERQIRAVSHQIKDLVEAHGQFVYRTSADSDARWIVIDCVDVVVHLLEPNERSFRDFESMWGDAPRLAWERTGEDQRQAAGRQGAVATPLKSDTASQPVESAFAPVERVAPAPTKRAKGAKAAKVAAGLAEAAPVAKPAPAAKATAVAKAPKAKKKAKPAKRGVSKAKLKAKAAAKADGTTAKRRAAAKLVKRAATKAGTKVSGKAGKKVAKRVAKKAGSRKDKPMVRPAKKSATAARSAATKPAGTTAKRKPSGK